MANIFIPKEINVGFDARPDTYTGKLAYIIYFDEKGVLRKEKSWEQWRDTDIPNEVLSNVPTNGFVLNKRAGGYSSGWNQRATYVRVFDPRGFEFEITIPNLLYILENTNSIMGKGLDGEFVYGWDGTELVLVPIASPDYVDVMAYTDALFNTQNIAAKHLIKGATYLTKDNKKYVFVGKFTKWSYSYDYAKSRNGERVPYDDGQQFFFYDLEDETFNILKNITKNKFIGVIDGGCVSNYVDIMDRLEYEDSYSQYDSSKDEYVEYSLDKLRSILQENKWPYGYVFLNGKYRKIRIESTWKDGDYDPEDLTVEDLEEGYKVIIKNATPEDVISQIKPYFKREYLANGNLSDEGGC